MSILPFLSFLALFSVVLYIFFFNYYCLCRMICQSSLSLLTFPVLIILYCDKFFKLRIYNCIIILPLLGNLCNFFLFKSIYLHVTKIMFVIILRDPHFTSSAFQWIPPFPQVYL